MTTLFDILRQYRENIRIAEAFADKFSARLEALNINQIFVVQRSVISLDLFADSDRERIIRAAGEVFGKDGWEAIYGSKVVMWQKIVEGVLVTLYNCEDPPIAPFTAKIAPEKFSKE